MKNYNSEFSIIKHPGIVTKVTEQNIFVQINVASACAQCHAQGMCKVLSSSNKTIKFNASDYPDIKVGQQVNILMRKELGFKALVLGYIFPAILLIISIFVSFYFFRNDLYASIAALAVLLLYYLILSTQKNKLKKNFSFTLEV